MAQKVLWILWFVSTVASLTLFMESLIRLKIAFREHKTKNIFVFSVLLVLSGCAFIFLIKKVIQFFSGIPALLVITIFEPLGIYDKRRTSDIPKDETYKGD
jgi:hypothetical protein